MPEGRYGISLLGQLYKAGEVFIHWTERQDDGTDDCTGSCLILRLVSQCLVWKGHAYPWWTPNGSPASLLWDGFRDSQMGLEQRVESRLFPEQCSCFQNQQGQTFCSGALVTSQWKVSLSATISGFPPKFVMTPLTRYWVEPCCNIFPDFHHRPQPTHSHIHPCSADDRSRLHHILFHRERAISIFLGYFYSL